MKILRFCLPILLFLASIHAAASDLRVNGFASIVSGTYSEDDSTYLGYGDDISFDPDTIVGIQLTKEITDDLKLTAQFVSRGSENYDISAEWAYLTYSINENWDVRAGRLRVPFFYYSDYLDVGFAYNWISPPSEVYRIGQNNFVGVDTIYRAELGDWQSSWQGFYGRLEDELTFSGISFDIDIKNYAGLSATFSRDWLTLRASYVRGDTSADNGFILPLLESIEGAGYGELANQIDPANELAFTYWALSSNIDYENWLLTAEFTANTQDRVQTVSEDIAYLFSVGRRFDDFIFHVTYAVNETDPDFSLNTIPKDGDPELAALSNTLDSVISNFKNTSLTAGIRYDVMSNAALKFEVTRFDSELAETLAPDQTSSLNEGTLIRFGIDVMF